MTVSQQADRRVQKATAMSSFRIGGIILQCSLFCKDDEPATTRPPDHATPPPRPSARRRAPPPPGLRRPRERRRASRGPPQRQPMRKRPRRVAVNEFHVNPIDEERALPE